MLHMEDKLYSEPSYMKAASGAIRCYLALHDHPDLLKRPNADRPETDLCQKSKIKKKETTNAHKKGQPP